MASAPTTANTMSQEAAQKLPIIEKSNRHTCVNCKTAFESTEAQRAHFKTEWHLYNLKRKVCKLEPIDLASFEQIHALAPEVAVPADKKRGSRGNQQDTTQELQEIRAQAQATAANQSGATLDQDSDWEELDEYELIDEDYDEDEAAELLSRVVPEDTCLFCDKKSPDIEANVKHMDSTHGFFIPESQYLIDLEGLVEYLGFKVGAGATCLWCNKQFTTLHGVRLHMLYKDHCKIRYDQEKAIDEFKDFYDYSGQEQIPMKPLSELAIPKKRSERHAEYQRALVLRQKTSGSGASMQLVAKKNPAIIAGTFQSKSIKKFDAQRAKRLLHIGMTNNEAVRGRLRRQNPM